jgi:hypothetical protein
MRSVVRRYRTLSRDPLLVLATVLVALLGFALLRVDWPLSYRMFAVGGSTVGVHPDGRVLVGHAHTISIVDPQKGAVTATIPMGLLTPRGGLVGVPGTSQAQTLTTLGETDTVTTVDLDATAVTIVRPTSPPSVADRGFLAAGVDSAGNLLGRIRKVDKAPQAVGLKGLVWTGDKVSGLPGVGDSFRVLSASPDGSLLYAATYGRVLVIDPTSQQIRADLTLNGSSEAAPTLDPSLLLTADGNHIITGAGRGQIVVRTLVGNAVATIDTGGKVNGIALSPDGATLYAVLDDRMLAVDVGGYA